MKLIPTIIAALSISASLAACSEDPPAVCGSADDLRASVADVKEIDLASSSSLSDLQAALTAVGDDVAAVRSDAAEEFASQIDAVEASYAELTSTVESAQAGISADLLTAAGEALATFGTDVDTLVEDVEATC